MIDKERLDFLDTIESLKQKFNLRQNSCELVVSDSSKYCFKGASENAKKIA